MVKATQRIEEMEAAGRSEGRLEEEVAQLTEEISLMRPLQRKLDKVQYEERTNRKQEDIWTR